MQPARNWNSQPAAPAKKAWRTPALRRIELTEQELALVRESESPSSVLAQIYRKRRDADILQND